MLSINNGVVARGAHSSSLTNSEVGGGSGGGGSGGGITQGSRYLFWNSLIVGKRGRGVADGIRVVRRWLLTLLTTRLDVRLVLGCKMVVSTNITTH